MGGENDIIIFATTRSNPTRDLGFVTQPEILNVATSRQLRKLIVVGDNAETSSEGSPTSKRMFDFIAAKASMLSINEH
jgi:superfamily I DNA and/or RNA helicase